MRISLAGRVICFLCVTPLCGVSGRYNLFEGCPEVDGWTVRVFLSVLLCCGGYGTVEMVGGWLFFTGFFSLLSILLSV